MSVWCACGGVDDDGVHVVVCMWLCACDGGVHVVV